MAPLDANSRNTTIERMMEPSGCKRKLGLAVRVAGPGWTSMHQMAFKAGKRQRGNPVQSSLEALALCHDTARALRAEAPSRRRKQEPCGAAQCDWLQDQDTRRVKDS